MNHTMEQSLKDEALILSYQLHRNDSLETLCFCDACKRIRKTINVLKFSEIRSFLGNTA